jgi:hypothetical protein
MALLSLSVCGYAVGEKPELFGPVPGMDYLTGRFNPWKHSLFVSLDRLNIPTQGRKHILRKETARALKRLYSDFRKDHPEIPFWIQSSTRNFYDQKAIWEGKWTGKRRVGGRELNKSIPDPLKRAREILKYSSMPGTSRHHWGTDFDINKLNNRYYSSGKGKILYEWMRKHAHRYGFCQPYTAGRKSGYYEERWHWSYMPLSVTFLEEWNRLYRKDPGAFKRKGLFAGSRSAGHLAPIYVNSISKDCK